MINIYDTDLKLVGVLDNYNSSIFAKRYRENGDCEVYLPATQNAIAAAKMGYYLAKTGDSVLYRINYIELTTDAENGNFLTVKGIDAKSFIDQRVVLRTSIARSSAEAFALSLVDDSLGASADADRQLKDSGGNLIFETASQGFTDQLTEQVSYKNVGDKIREYCSLFGWGYKAELVNGKIQFSFYKGADRSDSVVFSPEYENITTSDYFEDRSELKNYVLIGGQGQGADRVMVLVGDTSGADRYEMFVDAKDQSSIVTYGEMTKAYSGGTIVPVLGTETFEYVLNGTTIATLDTDAPTSDTKCNLTLGVYELQLVDRAVAAVSEYKAKTEFESEVIPNVTFVYGQDYFLGDIVKVENEFGISVNARISEVVEVEDENGYSIQPTFEYLTGE